MPVNAHVIDAGGLPENGQPKSRLGGAARIAAGGVCTLVGVPMLILPGPGLLAIGGGIYLMADGKGDLGNRLLQAAGVSQAAPPLKDAPIG